MDDEHRGNSEGGGEGVTITSVDDAGDGRSSEAVFADFAITVEVRVDAEKAVVMKGLDNGDALLRGSPIDGG